MKPEEKTLLDDDAGTRDPNVQPAPTAPSEDLALADTKQLLPEPKEVSVGLTNEVGPSRYQLIRGLESGGLGEILLAHDKRLDRAVAVKRLKQQERDPARFLREALLTAKLEHPSIVPVHDLWQQDGAAHYAMKLIEGRSLAAVLEKLKTLPERLALLPQLINVCEALAYAHAKNIIHRDLKPQNIMIGSFGEAIVIDWGLAKEAGASPTGLTPALSISENGEGLDEPGLTQAGAVLGTPAYMPPEQARGEPVDARADVYSLGAILYAVVSGAQPYSGKTAKEIISQVIKAPPTPLEDKQPDAPHDLVSIIKKAMAQDASARYASAKELAQDLKTFQAQQRVSAHHYSLIERSSLWAQRHRTAVRVGVFALALLALVVASSLLFLYRSWSREALARNIAESNEQRAKEASNKATAAQEKATRGIIALLKEQGRQEYLAGDRDRAAAFLGEAYREASALGAVDPSLRFLLAQVMPRTPKKTTYLEKYPGPAQYGIFSPDKSRVLVVSGENIEGGEAATLYDASSGELLFSVPSLSLSSAAFSPDGALLLLSTYNQKAQLWDVSAKKLLRSLGAGADASHAVFTADASRVVLVGVGGVPSVWDVATGKELVSLIAAYDSYDILLFSPDGSRIATVTNDSAGVAELWDATTGAQLDSFEGHTAPINAIAFSPDGARVLTASKDRTARLWEISGTLLLTLEGHAKEVLAAHFTKDGERIVTSDGETTRLWSASEGWSAGFVEGWSTAPLEEVLSSSAPEIEIEVKRVAIVEYHEGRADRVLRAHSDVVRSVELSPDGKKILTSGDKTAKLWDLSGKLLVQFNTDAQGRIQWGRFSPDGARVVTLDEGGVVRFWDASTGGHLFSLAEAASFSAVSFSLDGTKLLTVSEGTVQLREAASGELKLSLPGSAKYAGYSPGGQHLYIVRDGVVELWDVEATQRGRLLKTNAGVVEFSPDESLLATVHRDEVQIWSIASGSLVTAARGIDWRMALGFHPAGGLFAMANKSNHVEVRGVSDGALFASLLGHESDVTSVVFSPDGGLIATASYDHTVKLWDATSGDLLASLVGHFNEVSALVFSPDGAFLVTASADHTVRIWDIRGETREAEEILKVIRERVSWMFEAGRLVPR